MASPYQQQVFRRKLIYTACILVLLGFTWWLRAENGFITTQAEDLHIREQDRGDVELTGAFVRLSLIGSRGLATCILWSTAMEKQKKNQWNELEVIVRSLTKLQPHFITPWLFQSWNLAYNVSVESDRPRDKYFYIARGIQLLAEGERRNHNHPDLRWNIGFYTQHKIGRSDETNVLRSIFQLSYVPPNERDPARFWEETPQGRKVKEEPFALFCQKYPQLVRRLRTGIRRQSKDEWERQFICGTPEDVVRFLEDNWRIPSLYELPERQAIGSWVPDKEDKYLPMAERFPVLPPTRTTLPEGQVLYRADFLTRDQVPLEDRVNCFEVAKTWYGYAQEPIPPADVLPGSTKPFTNRAVQRRPKHMTTLLFRVYPAHAQRFTAERLQEEGWYLDEGWDIKGWFRNNQFLTAEGNRVEARVGAGEKWSVDAWKASYELWTRIGEDNHLIISSPELQNKRKLAEQFRERYGISPHAPFPQNLHAEDIPPDLRPSFQAARFLFEYDFYRGLSRFPFHRKRSQVEADERTVKARRLFYEAEKAEMLRAELDEALADYEDPDGLAGWKAVLVDNADYRTTSSIQDYTAEVQWRYLRLRNRLEGRRLKERVAKLATGLPLLMPAQELPGPIIQGPFDVTLADGTPLLPRGVYEATVRELDPSMRMRSRQVQATPSSTD